MTIILSHNTVNGYKALMWFNYIISQQAFSDRAFVHRHRDTYVSPHYLFDRFHLFTSFFWLWPLFNFPFSICFVENEMKKTRFNGSSSEVELIHWMKRMMEWILIKANMRNALRIALIDLFLLKHLSRGNGKLFWSDGGERKWMKEAQKIEKRLRRVFVLSKALDKL